MLAYACDNYVSLVQMPRISAAFIKLIVSNLLSGLTYSTFHSPAKRFNARPW